MKIETLMNKSNAQDILTNKLDRLHFFKFRFIKQNISYKSTRNKILKGKEVEKYNNRYRVPKSQFRRPIYNGITFLDKLKKELNVKIEKKVLPYWLKGKDSDGNSDAKSLNSLESVSAHQGKPILNPVSKNSLKRYIQYTLR